MYQMFAITHTHSHPSHFRLLLKRISTNPGSVYVNSIQPGSMADRCKNIQLGDNILAVNGENVKSRTLSQVQALMKGAGDVLRLDVDRGGVTVQVILQRRASLDARRPEELRGSSQSDKGAQIVSGDSNVLGSVLESFFGRGQEPESAGIGVVLDETSSGAVVLSKIRPGSNADKARVFQVGDQVLAVGEESVSGRPLAWVKSRILGKPGTTVLLTMLRGDRPYTMVVIRDSKGSSHLEVDHVPEAMSHASPPCEGDRMRRYHLVGQRDSSLDKEGDDVSLLGAVIDAPQVRQQQRGVPAAPSHVDFTSSPAQIINPPGIEHPSPGKVERVLMGQYWDMHSSVGDSPGGVHQSPGLDHVIQTPSYFDHHCGREGKERNRNDTTQSAHAEKLSQLQSPPSHEAQTQFGGQVQAESPQAGPTWRFIGTDFELMKRLGPTRRGSREEEHVSRNLPATVEQKMC